MRVLVTGSRNWRDEQAVQDALDDLAGPPGRWTLIHGGARGLDAIAGKLAHQLGMKVEVHAAGWIEHGKKAGVLRNQTMVDLGADVCLAFPLPESRGTWDCIHRAQAAGITTRIIEVTT